MTSLPTVLWASLYFASAVFFSKTCNHPATATSNAPSPITRISYSSTGGRSGNYENLEVSSDSLVYLQARRGHEQIIKEKITTDSWRQFTTAISLEDFDRIKSNPGHALYDGIDITIVIETGEAKHTIVNGQEDTANYKKISPFTHLLEKKLAEVRTKVTW